MLAQLLCFGLPLHHIAQRYTDATVPMQQTKPQFLRLPPVTQSTSKLSWTTKLEPWHPSWHMTIHSVVIRKMTCMPKTWYPASWPFTIHNHGSTTFVKPCQQAQLASFTDGGSSPGNNISLYAKCQDLLKMSRLLQRYGLQWKLVVWLYQDFLKYAAHYW